MISLRNTQTCCQKWCRIDETLLTHSIEHQTPGDAEMSQVLRKIAALDDLGCKICLFLDGLDEYSGDHRALIADLRALCTNKSIKICVSSRPWNVFVSAFSSLDTVLHLEELTADDIYRYASGHLTKADRRLQQSDVDSLASESSSSHKACSFGCFLLQGPLKTGSMKAIVRRSYTDDCPRCRQTWRTSSEAC